jgi:hypothetical protein
MAVAGGEREVWRRMLGPEDEEGRRIAATLPEAPRPVGAERVVEIAAELVGYMGIERVDRGRLEAIAIEEMGDQTAEDIFVAIGRAHAVAREYVVESDRYDAGCA